MKRNIKQHKKCFYKLVRNFLVAIKQKVAENLKL